MESDIPSLIRAWDGEAVITCYEPAHDAWIFVAIHSSALGRPTGGTRMRVYPRPEDGLLDALRLAEGMTWKWAGLEVRRGGGKAVLALPRPLDEADRRTLLERYARLLESLRGAFATGEDLGTTPADMALLAETTRWVHGGRAAGVEDPGPYTAEGVLAGIQAAVETTWGSPRITGRRVLVQGAGDVGGPLARRLAAEGAEVLVAEPDAARAAALRSEVGAELIDPGVALETECDVLAPCAIGEVLNERTIPRLRCRVVAGSANAQLATAADAQRLHDRGILYVPDWVINAGGALAIALDEDDGPPPLDAMRRIGDAVRAVLTEAAVAGEPPLAAARRRARRVLDAAGEQPPLPERHVYREID